MQNHQHLDHLLWQRRRLSAEPTSKSVVFNPKKNFNERLDSSIGKYRARKPPQAHFFERSSSIRPPEDVFNPGKALQRKSGYVGHWRSHVIILSSQQQGSLSTMKTRRWSACHFSMDTGLLRAFEELSAVHDRFRTHWWAKGAWRVENGLSVTPQRRLLPCSARSA